MSIAASDSAGGGTVACLQEHLHQGCDGPFHQHAGTDGLKLTLNALRLGESFDTIKLDVGLLAWHIGHFPRENNTTGERVSEDDLNAILELSQNIGTNVDKIFTLRNQDTVPPDVQSMSDGAISPLELHDAHPKADSRRRKSHDLTHRASTRRPRSVSCRTCLTHHTPKWRNGPAGPGTLCNVCGLIYAKRRGRVRSKPVRQPSSC